MAQVVATRVGGFDLHSLHDTAVSVSKGAAGSWVKLAAGRQMALRDGDRVSLEGRGEFICQLPRAPQPTAAAPPISTAAATAAGDIILASRETQAHELVSLTAREAQIMGELTSGLQGKQLRAVQRNLSAAHDAFVGVALGAAADQDPVHAARIASNKLAKVANDGDKKRRREETSDDRASAKAQRRENHRQPQGRAPGLPPKGHGTQTARPAKRDRRTFEGRTVARKIRRVGDEARHVEISSQGRRGGYGRGGGRSGRGGHGSGGHSFGGKGKGRGKGGGKGNDRGATHGGGRGKGGKGKGR